MTMLNACAPGVAVVNIDVRACASNAWMVHLSNRGGRGKLRKDISSV